MEAVTKGAHRLRRGVASRALCTAGCAVPPCAQPHVSEQQYRPYACQIWPWLLRCGLVTGAMATATAAAIRARATTNTTTYG